MNNNFEVKKIMMMTVMFFSVISVSTFVKAQTFKEWDDLSVTQLNRERAHTLEIPVSSLAAFNAAKTPVEAYEASPDYLSLNGVWKFHWQPNPSESLPTPKNSDTDWDNIDVPSAWQVYGVHHNKNWDKPLYVNTRFPFTYDKQTYSVMADRPSDWTYSGNMKNPVGTYQRTFTLPEGWDKNRDVFLRFNGAGHGYYVWVNGKFVGYAEDSYLPSEFDVTRLVRKGTNSIMVRIFRFTTGSFLECQDYWRLTGITRDVFLWSAPKTHIRDFFFRTVHLDNNGEGKSSADALLTASLAGKDKNLTLSARILDGERSIAHSTVSLQSADGDDTGLNFSVKDITPWSAENPKLYTLELTLSTPKGVIDTRLCRVGFRTVGIREDGALLINGNRAIFHGVDRHTFAEDGGRFVTKADIMHDLLQMKRLNINAIRTSHYPNNPYFYDLCDQLGFYVLAEADVECHGNTHLSDVKEFEFPMVERNMRQVLTLRNHTCICLWSGGNESGGGKNFSVVMDSIKRLDTSRLTHYQGNSQWSDVTSTMYGRLPVIKRFGRERLEAFNRGEKGIRPHIQCENTHAMGNSMGSQREFFDLYETYPALTGEFIWDWKDQGLKVPVPGRSGEYYWAYGGDFGDRPNDNNFCCNGVVLPDGSFTSKSYNVKKIYQPLDIKVGKDNNTFVFFNKLQQMPLRDVRVTYTVLEDGMPLRSSVIPDFTIEPNGNREFTLNPLAGITMRDDAEYAVRFVTTTTKDTPWEKAGYEVASEQIPLRAALLRPVYKCTANAKVNVSDKGNKVTVSGKDFSITFADGMLSAYEADGHSILSAPLSFRAFRLPTDNDKASQASSWDNMGLRDLKLHAGKWNIQKSADGRSADISIVNRYTGRENTEFTVTEHFKVYADGNVLFAAHVHHDMAGVELPRLGFRTELPAGSEVMRWYGRGPWDSYLDRLESQFPAVYKSTVTEQWANYVKPQETGNKEEVRWLAVTDNCGVGMLFVAPELMAASTGHWRPEDLYVNINNRKNHPYEVDFIPQTVVNLDIFSRALGNATCGPDVIDKYKQISSDNYYSLFLMPLAKPCTDAELTEKARITSPLSPMVKIIEHKGIVTLESSASSSEIFYSRDGGKYQKYTTPIDMTNGGKISAYCIAKGREKSPLSVADILPFLDKSAWKILSVSSNKGGKEDVRNILDNDPATIWHTNYNPADLCPHELVIDMNREYPVKQFVYQGRADMINGRVRDVEVYFSNDPQKWGSAALKCTLMNHSNAQQIDVPSHPRARYMKVIIRSTHDNHDYASAAEIGIAPEQ